MQVIVDSKVFVVSLSPQSSLRFREAEQWCSLGMRFLKHLDQQKTAYEEQVGENTHSAHVVIFENNFFLYSDDDRLH